MDSMWAGDLIEAFPIIPLVPVLIAAVVGDRVVVAGGPWEDVGADAPVHAGDAAELLVRRVDGEVVGRHPGRDFLPAPVRNGER